MNPILNNPYEAPAYHYATDQEGNLDYSKVIERRRPFTPGDKVIPTKQGPQKGLFGIEETAKNYADHPITLLRKEVGAWRATGYPGTTRVTLELLTYWFNNPERLVTQQLFFAQRETIETAIWLNEVAARSNAGTHILSALRAGQQTVSDNPLDHLPRLCFKMATGSGKTVVMAALILYHYCNRQQYRQDTRFADYFLVVAPGITIRDRLGVLRPDTTGDRRDATDYYQQRRLVPPAYERLLDGLSSRVVLTNYHQMEPRTLSGNQRGAFDGKVGSDGKKVEALEDYGLVFRRLLKGFRPGARLLVLNDEAHHCYLPQAKPGKKPIKVEGEEDGENVVAENARAAVWFSGLREAAQRFQLAGVYDLSATPYYLRGSGYEPYTFFPWIVTDFNLVEAIESGLVKIPYLPEEDDTQKLDGAVLRYLYDEVKKRAKENKDVDLPKMGKRTERKEKGKDLIEQAPRLPMLVQTALSALYSHYTEYDEGVRERGERQADLLSTPPVLIVVCNNTGVSKEVYKHIAGYETEDAQGQPRAAQGVLPLFSNYESSGLPKVKPPTLLIDSDALENSGQIDESFRRVFKDEITQFRREYAKLKGESAASELTDADLLREVVNTVGRKGKLGAHVRCVVSVSMLTEGWDANTVTHIMGLRAFGSQLLCEQVAGRALRRRHYELQGYDKEGEPTTDKRRIVNYKFPPEYARIIGIPFKAFPKGKGGEGGGSGQDPTAVYAMDERQDLELIFPNLIGYRQELPTVDLTPDFTGIEPYQLDLSTIPRRTLLENAFSGATENLTLELQEKLRDGEVIYHLTREVLRYHFTDLDNRPKLEYFAPLRRVVEQWYDGHLKVLHQTDPIFRRLVKLADGRAVAQHIQRGIVQGTGAAGTRVRPVPDYYNRLGSTRYVSGATTRPTYPTRKSHVNVVVADTDTWEQICAKTLETRPEVLSYVKNAFLDFRIPYANNGRDQLYYPDFLAQVRAPSGGIVNLIIEVTGMNKDKQAKKHYVEHYWLPSVNSALTELGLNPDEPWAFVEISDQIESTANQLIEKISSL